MSRVTQISARIGAGLLVAGVGVAGVVVSSSAGGVQESGSIVVSKTEIVEGETITVSNAADDASRCEGGLVVIYVSNLPPGPLSQRLPEVDEQGNWSLEFTAPFAADFPSMAIGPDYTFSGTCEGEELQQQSSGTPLRPTAVPPFTYAPVTVNVVDQEVPAEPEAPADPTVDATADPATPAAAAPTFAG